MRGNAVVRLAADSALGHDRGDPVRIVMANHVKMPGGRRTGGRTRQVDEVAEAGLLVVASGGTPPARPAVEMRQRDAEDRGLQLIEPRVVPDVLERRLVVRAVKAQ